MKKNVVGASLVLVGALVLSGCGGEPVAPNPNPVPEKIAAQTVPFDLRDNITSPLWTYGPGTLTLRRAELGKNAVGLKVTEAPIDNAGRGSVQLPGEDQGVLALADQSVTASLNYLVPGLLDKCVAPLTESNTAARALFVGGANFATQDGGKTLQFLHVETADGKSSLVRDLLVFVTADDTVSGSVSCGGGSPPLAVNLAFKRGWNSLVLGLGESLTVRPLASLSLTADVKFPLPDDAP